MSVRTVSVILAVLSLSSGRAAMVERRASQAPPSKSTSATYSIKAEMVEAENKAKQRSATVIVTTEGVRLIDPATVNETARIGDGHLHYRVDDGPVIATTASKLGFHELSRGVHKISVWLAANDHTSLTAPITFTLTIP